MKCGFCDKTDGLCYASNPPMVKCTLAGEFHRYGEECNATVTAKIDKSSFGIAKPCLICGESVVISELEIRDSKICDKCKEAVISVRERLDAYKSGKPILD